MTIIDTVTIGCGACYMALISLVLITIGNLQFNSRGSGQNIPLPRQPEPRHFVGALYCRGSGCRGSGLSG